LLKISTLSKNLSSNFTLFFFLVGKRREAEERGEGTGERDFEKRSSIKKNAYY
jgi:hypothetical protein